MFQTLKNVKIILFAVIFLKLIRIDQLYKKQYKIYFDKDAIDKVFNDIKKRVNIVLKVIETEFNKCFDSNRS